MKHSDKISSCSVLPPFLQFACLIFTEYSTELPFSKILEEMVEKYKITGGIDI